jgi:hypothetical protein
MSISRVCEQIQPVLSDELIVGFQTLRKALGSVLLDSLHSTSLSAAERTKDICESFNMGFWARIIHRPGCGWLRVSEALG